MAGVKRTWTIGPISIIATATATQEQQQQQHLQQLHKLQQLQQRQQQQQPHGQIHFCNQEQQGRSALVMLEAIAIPDIRYTVYKV